MFSSVMIVGGPPGANHNFSTSLLPPPPPPPPRTTPAPQDGPEAMLSTLNQIGRDRSKSIDLRLPYPRSTRSTSRRSPADRGLRFITFYPCTTSRAKRGPGECRAG